MGNVTDCGMSWRAGEIVGGGRGGDCHRLWDESWRDGVGTVTDCGMRAGETGWGMSQIVG